MNYKIGDRVKIIKSAIVGQGVITVITKGGEEIGFPWKDKTPHYGFIDEKTKIPLIAHEKELEKVK